jgi:type II secretory pathway pseudopilin PulG
MRSTRINIAGSRISHQLPAPPAFTLIELLVVMGLITGLAALAMLVVPGALERDRTVDAVNQLQSMLAIAQARALRDNHPHGIRLVIDTAQSNSSLIIAQEVQYIEMPPALLPSLPASTAGEDPRNYPYIQFLYSYDNTGQITNRRCQLINIPAGMLPTGSLTGNQRLILVVPTLGTWHTITAINSIPNGVELLLASYPDHRLGAAGPPTKSPDVPVADYPVLTLYSYYFPSSPNYRSPPQFAIYRAPQPLLGENIVRLPRQTCVDLSPEMSQPDGGQDWAWGRDYDLLFLPSGQLSPYGSSRGAGQVFLWIRDPDKPDMGARMDPTYYGGVLSPAYQTALRQAGEQMIIAIKANNGSIIATPVYWPDATNTDRYWFARQALVGQ